MILRGGSESFHSSRAIHRALAAGPCGRGPARRRDPTRADARPCGGRRHAVRPRRQRSTSWCRVAARRSSVASKPKRACPCSRISKASAMSTSTRRRISTMAKRIVLNAKMRRTGVCGAAETLLVDREACGDPPEAARRDAHCSRLRDPRRRATRACRPSALCRRPKQDWSHRISRRNPVGEGGRRPAGRDRPCRALRHTPYRRDRHGRPGCRGEIPARGRLRDRPAQRLDPIRRRRRVRLRGEIGIATGRLHARGPVGVEQLCSFKYRVHGTGQTRP